MKEALSIRKHAVRDSLSRQAREQRGALVPSVFVPVQGNIGQASGQRVPPQDKIGLHELQQGKEQCVAFSCLKREVFRSHSRQRWACNKDCASDVLFSQLRFRIKRKT
ncbi:MAG: hypothetical protein IT361_02675 [Gemmatimonadaceae bacterium]|nr:hypothetical protein [Gemmatimonadaceae bacterium]